MRRHQKCLPGLPGCPSPLHLLPAAETKAQYHPHEAQQGMWILLPCETHHVKKKITKQIKNLQSKLLNFYFLSYRSIEGSNKYITGSFQIWCVCLFLQLVTHILDTTQLSSDTHIQPIIISLSHIHTHTHTRTYQHILTYKQTTTSAITNMPSNTKRQMERHTHIHVHTYTNTDTSHTCILTCMHTHTQHKHIHTNTITITTNTTNNDQDHEEEEERRR